MDLSIKVPPCSKESETLVLGAMLSSQCALAEASDMLSLEDFYFSEHKTVFTVLKQAQAEGKPTDIHLAAQTLKSQGRLKDIGGIAFLVNLAQYAGTSIHVTHYCQIVSDLAVRRKLIAFGQMAEGLGWQDSSGLIDDLEKIQQEYYALTKSMHKDSGVLLNQAFEGIDGISEPFLMSLENRIKEQRASTCDKPSLTGLSTGFVELDSMLHGLNKSNLIILAARPSMGKTALALNIAEYVCFNCNKPVGIFSLEMSTDQLLLRLASSQSEIDSSRIQKGLVDTHEFQSIRDNIHRIKNLPMVIDDQSGLTITEIRARARRMKQLHGIEFLVIDYIQLLSGSKGSRAENRTNEISEISRQLKTLARELNIPILCLSQLSRKVDERTGHKPVLSDLRDSGSIEQDADVVMMLMRREYYDKLDKPGTAELIIAKNRHGEVGTVSLAFLGETVRFMNLHKGIA